MGRWFAPASAYVSKGTGHPLGLVVAIVASLLLWRLIGAERTILLVSFLTWWQLFPLQASQNRDTAEIKAMLREMVRDIPEVDEARAKRRAEGEE